MSEIIVASRNLEQHKINCTAVKPYRCQLCPKSFMNGTTLNRHVMSHTGEKPFKCQSCEKSFSSRYNLQRHETSHDGEKPWKCEFCEKSFIQKGHLKVHMRSHTGEKPYKCQLCEKSYTGSTGLKVHMRTHTGEKPYKCQLCIKSFTRVGDLKMHVRTHTGESPYTCQLCQKSFSTISGLNSHILVHTENLLYLCVLCNKRFACVTSLKKHRRTHAAEKQQSLHKSCSSLKLPRHHAGTQPRCLKLDNNSPALSGTEVIDKPNECPSKNMHLAFGEENTPPSSISIKECQSMFITKPLEKSFRCGLCGKMLEIENEFENHCPSHRLSPPDALFNDMGRFCIHCKPNSSSFAQQFKCYASTQPQCPKIENHSAACLHVSVPFTTLYGEGVIDEPTECLSMSMHPGSSEKSSPLAKIPVEEYHSIRSQEDGEPDLGNSFGCGICGEMLAIEKEFQDHCSSHRLSPPDDLCIDMFRFLISNAWS